MILRFLKRLFQWTVVLGAIGGLFYVAYRVHGAMQAELAKEGGEELRSPRRAHDGVVELAAEDVERLGVVAAPAAAVAWSERVAVYGEVVPNPRGTVEVRSPFAGTLRASSEAPWPAAGRRLRAGQVLGRVDIRIGAQERLALLDNLNNARLKKEGAAKVVELQRERVRRVETVLRSNIVPGQQLDDAKVLLADAETQLAIASAAVELWKKALDEADRPGGRESSTYSYPLTAPADGEVTELAARPGMAVEAGALVAQIVDFRRPLARLDVPPGLLGSGPPPERVQLVAIPARPSALGGVAAAQGPGDPTATLSATLVGPAPRVDAASQLVGYWYEAGPAVGDGPGAAWRPGLMVKASLNSASATSRPAVAVPAGAVLFHQGRALVYVRVKPGTFERREVVPLGRDGESWDLAPREGTGPTGLEPGDVVVTSGAQVLLSEEFRADDVEAD
ncbi:MAG TPA: HlyD family efflux transporter periplasmic adaptor subunit [Isosphaeraceae bacterium]|jgi:biotin carboxyl carrier protein|nr:HlyD family efflux transporter periplasmic adaptor subunit [Isosphaeraceae bacterium]